MRVGTQCLRRPVPCSDVYLGVSYPTCVPPDAGRRESGILATPISAMRKVLHQQDLAMATKRSMFESQQQAKAASRAQKTAKRKGKGPVAGANSLWVDKYAPKGFADLLSQDETNRNVLKWVRGWDEQVFGYARGAGNTARVPKPQKKAWQPRSSAGGGPSNGPCVTATLLCVPCPRA